MKVVIVGAGFGGLEAARSLRKAEVRLQVIDQHNHHLFQPLLYQVATAGLSPADISIPIRSVLRSQANAEVRLGQVTGVDWREKHVLVGEERLPYDCLILATGSRNLFSPSLKTLLDATSIRRRILLAFEKAEQESEPEKRKAWLTFVLVGGGPTGVEMAGAIAELANHALAKDFRHIDPRSSRVILLEGGPRILSTFPESLSAKAVKALTRLGAEVMTGKMVEQTTPEGVKVGGEWIPSRTVLWAVGVKATPVAQWLEVEPDRAGRVKVAPDLSVPGREGVFVIGDAAHVPGPDGLPLPGVAPVAKQQGRYVAERLRKGPRGPFRYVDKGNLATIGRRHAIADVRGWKFSGFPAWILWVVVHVLYLIGFKNRLLVLIQWAWNWITFQRGARLILPGGPDEK